MVLLDWRKPFDKACYDILVDKMQTRAWRVLWESPSAVPSAGADGSVLPGKQRPNCVLLTVVTDLGESRD